MADRPAYNLQAPVCGIEFGEEVEIVQSLFAVKRARQRTLNSSDGAKGKMFF